IEKRGKGGDLLHIIVDGSRPVDRIVYEVKNTKGWQKAYLRQTKTAMEAHQTGHGILVSRVLPPGHSGMCVLAGVIVATPTIAKHVAAVLRDGIVAVSRLKISEEGKNAKMEALFNYIRSDRFRISIRKIQEKIAELQEALLREKSLHEGSWNTR